MGNKQFTIGQIVKHKLTGEKFIVIQNNSFWSGFKVRRAIKKPVNKLPVLCGSVITYDDYVEESFFDPNEFESWEGEFKGA